MNLLGNGLSDAKHHEAALSVRETDLATRRRLGADEESILITQNNLANTYQTLGWLDEALQLKRDVYSGHLRLWGEENIDTLISANNYAASLTRLERFDEAKSLLRKTILAARRVLGENNRVTLTMRKIYAKALYRDADATLDDLREAVQTLEDEGRIARRVLGGMHPLTTVIEGELQDARAALRRLRAHSLLPFGAFAVAVAVVAWIWLFFFA